MNIRLTLVITLSNINIVKSYDDILYEELYIDGDLLILYDKNEQIKTINLKMVMKLTLINYETINH